MSELSIKEIAGRHLGKTMSGESMMPYEAPREHDASLLVPMPREIGRKTSNITAPFQGYDVWHAYEFSFLKRGQPQTGVLKFDIDCKTDVMIESKSFKLYLNSFDFESFDSIEDVLKTIRRDLTPILRGRFSVAYHDARPQGARTLPLINWLTASVDDEEVDDITFDENPDLLESLYPSTGNIKLFHTANLRSACEITNQKDTGHCFIAMSGTTTFDKHELARYIFSLRDAQHFHENVTEIIYNTLYNRYNPKDLFILNAYNRRGGLDIHPARYTSDRFYAEVFTDHWNVKNYIALTNQV